MVAASFGVLIRMCQDVYFAPVRRSRDPQDFAGPTTPTLSFFELYLLGSQPESIDAFFAGLTPDLIMKLRPLSSSMLCAVDAYVARKWCAAASLGRWVMQPSQFLQVLDRCNGIISGSAAQRFFAREVVACGEMDVYVPLHGILPVGRMLQRDGYAFQPTEDSHPLFEAAALSHTVYVGKDEPWKPALACARSSYAPPKMFHFVLPRERRTYKLNGDRRIRIVGVMGDPVEYIVNNLPSSELTVPPRSPSTES